MYWLNTLRLFGTLFNFKILKVFFIYIFKDFAIYAINVKINLIFKNFY